MRTYYKEIDLDDVEHPEAFDINNKSNKFRSLIEQVSNNDIDLNDDDYVVDEDEVIV